MPYKLENLPRRRRRPARAMDSRMRVFHDTDPSSVTGLTSQTTVKVVWRQQIDTLSWPPLALLACGRALSELSNQLRAGGGLRASGAKGDRWQSGPLEASRA
jgi:hypothetical protein